MKVVEQLKSLSYDRAVAILYCGCKLVQSPTKVYYTNGFVMQGKIINE